MKRHLPLLLILCVGVSAGCSSKTFGLRNLRCDSGACLDGFTCDTVTDTCVAVGDACEEGRVLQCDPGAVACENGCRLCEGSVWSDCREIDLGDCTPNTGFCEGRFLVTCDFTGNRVGTPEDCGVSGCNDAAERCNDCPPDRTFCVGLDFVTCGPDGLEATRESCATPTQCSGAGTCSATLGCQVALTADDGTPCDEGVGQDGDFCNSSCVSGECMAGPAACDDGNDCTADSCDSLSGCIFANEMAIPCPGTDMDSCTSTCDGFGACADGFPVDCSDTNPCTLDNCATGICSNPPGNAGTECRAATGDCDVAEQCDGGSADCPADDVAAATVSCRAETGTGCDVEDFCDGSTKDCPSDAVQPDTFACRSPGGGEPCDAEEFCDGTTKDCPADGFLTGVVCRPEVPGGCDIADTCDGSGKGCPSDTVVMAGTECRAGGDACDPPETCDGTNPDCPTDFMLPDGQVCDLSCNMTVLTTTECMTGTCSSVSMMDCDDMNACNGTETCSDTLGCQGGGGIMLTGPVAQPRRRTTATVVLDVGCPGEAGNISCTAASTSLCLLNEDFEAGLGRFGGVSTVTCEANGDIPDGTGADNRCSGDTMELQDGDQAVFQTPLDITGVTNLVVYTKAGIADGNDDDDFLYLMACCGTDDGCLANVATIAHSSNDPTGQDAWGDRPCPSGSCSGAGLSLGVPSGCDTSSDLYIAFDMDSSSNNEDAEIDDFFVAGDATQPVSVSDNGDGTYDIQVSACSATSLTVDCTWDGGAAGMFNDSVAVTFGN